MKVSEHRNKIIYFVILMISFLIGNAFFSENMLECCKGMIEGAAVVFFPAMLFSMFTVGVHSAGIISFSIGVFLELSLAWLILSYAFTKIRPGT